MVKMFRIRDVICVFFAGVAIALCFAAGRADAAVYVQGKRVTVTQIGAISAAPCSNPYGCTKAVISLRWDHRANDHLVRCGFPRRLHVIGTYRAEGVRWVSVYACRKTYTWRKPR